MAATPRLELEDFIPYLINRVGAALVADFTATALSSHDLSIAMWRVLAALSASGEQRQIDIAAMTSIEVSTLSRLITRLMRRGLVTRRRSPHSSREVMVELSARGRSLVERLIPIARQLEDKAIAGVSPTEIAALKRALRQLYENLSGKT